MCKTTSLLICFGLVPALTPANVVRAAALDLVASWCFNEGSGSLAGDSSGNGHAGKLIGDPLWIKAGANYTLRFDGKDDYIFVSNLPILLDQPFMVQAWIMRGSEGRVIVSQPDGANWLMTAKTSGVVITELTRPALSSAFAIPRNEWHHLVLSRDTGAVSLYLDGQLAARGPWDPTTRSTGAFYIGCGSQRDRFWDGGIDEVRIYGQEAPSPGPSEPEPADGAVRVTASVLQWKPADAAVNQYIYLGTDINLVAASSPDVLAGATDRAIFPVPVALDWNAVYYWKVDTVTADGTLLPGRVWSFTTIASKPDPVPADVTRSWDSVMGFPNNGNWDADTGPERAIDNLVSLKYWHRDTPQANAGVGFRATPFVGATIVTELTFATAGDMPERDPVRFEFYGSNVSILGPFELIASGEIVDFGRATAWPRSTKSTTLIGFPNKVAYSHYQLLFTAVRNPRMVQI